MFNPGEIALMIPIIALSIPIVAITANHFEKMAKIKAEKSGGVPANVEAELTALRNEVASLRDTTTRFDMSFDAAITRLEDRVDRVEVKQTGTGTGFVYGYPNGTAGADETASLRQGAGR